MKRISFLFFFAICTSHPANAASNTLGGCQVQVPNLLSETNDWLTNGCQKDLISSANSQALQERYSKNLDLKLSALVAKQLKQSLEDLGSTSDFYELNDQSFPSTGKACGLGFIKEIEKSGCNGKGSTTEEKEKFKMLSDSLAGDRFKSTSLMDSVLHVYSMNKYGEGFGENKNQCPLNGSAFSLNSQITATSAKEIFNEFSLQGNEFNVGKMYEKYPTLSMIKDSGMQTEFENYIKSFKGNSDEAKTYLMKFFFDSKNKPKFSDAITHKCQQVQASLSSFICHPLSNKLPSDSKISKKMLDGYDTTKSFEEQPKKIKDLPMSRDIAAYKCMVNGKEKISSALIAPASAGSLINDDPNFCLNLTEESSSVDSYFRCFNEGVRPSSNIDSSLIQNFCSMYSCQNETVKNTASCKAGGPLSAKDLENLNLKDDSIANQIAYMKILEKHAQDRQNILASLNSTDQNGKKLGDDVIKGLSPFDIGLFGLEGALKVLNIPDKEITIALKEVGPNNSIAKPTSPEEVRQIVNREFTNNENVQVANNEQHFSPAISSNNNSSFVTNDSTYQPASNHIDSASDKDERVRTSSSPFVGGSATAAADAEKEQMIKDLKTLMDANKKEESEKTSSNFKAIESKPAHDFGKSAYEDEMRAWANSLSAKDANLRERENLANMRDSEYWQKYEELKRREADLAAKVADEKKSREPASVGGGNVGAKSTDFSALQEVKVAKAKMDQDLSATPAGLTVSAERLEKLDTKDLKDNHINFEEPFVISVRLKSKLIHVRVAKFKEGNRSYLAPYLNEDNMEVKEAILKSPIFREFRYFLEQKETAYTPVKKTRN